jgi:hypothetical protein
VFDDLFIFPVLLIKDAKKTRQHQENKTTKGLKD